MILSEGSDINVEIVRWIQEILSEGASIRALDPTAPTFQVETEEHDPNLYYFTSNLVISYKGENNNGS